MLECTTNRHARVAQRWSTSLPRRGSRVRFPSRALKKYPVGYFFVALFWGVLLYPACLMYRRRRSCCLTFLPVSAPRPSSVIFLLSKGTDCHFPSPVPCRRLFYRFPRVQTTVFLLLYPADALFSASHGYRRPFSFSCTRPTLYFPLPTGTDDHFSSPVPGRHRAAPRRRRNLTYG